MRRRVAARVLGALVVLVVGLHATPAQAQVPVAPPVAPPAPAAPVTPVEVPPPDGAEWSGLDYPDWLPEWMTPSTPDNCEGLFQCAWELSGDYLGGPSELENPDPYPVTSTLEVSESWDAFIATNSLAPGPVTYGSASPIAVHELSGGSNQALWAFLVTVQIAPDEWGTWVPVFSSQSGVEHFVGASLRVVEDNGVDVIQYRQRTSDGDLSQQTLPLGDLAVDADGYAHVLCNVNSFVTGSASGGDGTINFRCYTGNAQGENVDVLSAGTSGPQSLPSFDGTFWSGADQAAEWLPEVWNWTSSYPDDPAQVLATYYVLGQSNIVSGGTGTISTAAAAAFFTDTAQSLSYTPWLPPEVPELQPGEAEPTPDTIPQAPPAEPVPAEIDPPTTTPAPVTTAPATPEGDAAGWLYDGLDGLFGWLLDGLAALFAFLVDELWAMFGWLIDVLWSVAEWVVAELVTWVQWLANTISSTIWLALQQLLDYLGLMLGLVLQGMAVLVNAAQFTAQAVLAISIVLEQLTLWLVASLVDALAQLLIWQWNTLVAPVVDVILGYLGDLFGWLGSLLYTLFVPQEPLLRFDQAPTDVQVIVSDIGELQGAFTVGPSCGPSAYIPAPIDHTINAPNPSTSGCPGNGEGGARLTEDDLFGDLWGYRAVVRAFLSFFLVAGLFVRMSRLAPWANKGDLGEPNFDLEESTA